LTQFEFNRLPARTRLAAAPQGPAKTDCIDRPCRLETPLLTATSAGQGLPKFVDIVDRRSMRSTIAVDFPHV
jgi:hypothetical protein